MKILVCDDDNQIIESISELISAFSVQKKIDLQIDKRQSGDFVLKEKNEYDIAFVDIELPGISGLKLAEKLKAINPDVIVIIITQFPDYLDNAMKIQVFRYISKPINENRFFSALLDAIKTYYNISRTIIIDLKDEVYSVKTKDILYLETNKYGSTIVTKKGTFKTSKRVSEWLSVIDQPNSFIYSHNSFAVNLQNVIDFNCKEVKLRKSDDEIVTTYMSQRKFSVFKKSFLSFVGVKL